MATRKPATGFDSIFNRTQSTVAAKPSRTPKRNQMEPTSTIPKPQPVPAPVSAPPPPVTMGRPRTRIEKTSKVTTELPATLVGFLDGISATIKGTTGDTVSRTALLTAMIGALRESGLDLTGLSSEEEIHAVLLKKLKA